MQRAAALLFALVTVSGCKKGDGIVVLTVTAEPSLSDLTLLRVSATAAGRTVTFDDQPTQSFSLPPTRTLGIEFPASVAGTMQLHVEAQSGGNVVAKGDVTVSTTAGARSDIGLTLGIDGSPDVDMIGGGSLDMAGCGMVTTCTNNDNCCPAGCNQTTDSDCPSVCGNSVIEAGEVCDDGNSVNGDNCDPTCQFTNSVTLLVGVADGIGRADGYANTVRLGGPQGYGAYSSTTSITTDGGNFNMWFGDRCAVKWYDTSLSMITTIAGADGICDMAMDGVGGKARFTMVSEVEFVPNGGAGVLYVTGDTNLRKIDLATMQVSTISVPASDGTFYGAGMSHDATYLYLVDGTNGLRQMQLSNNAVTSIATITQLGNTGQCTDVVPYNGAFYVTCDGGIFKVVPGTPNPTVTTYVPGGGTTGTCKAGTLATASLGVANRITVDSQGGFTVTDSHCNVVWYVSASGAAVAAGSTSFTAGHADSMTSPTAGTLNAPTGSVYFSATASTYVVDTGSREIRSYSNFGLLTRAGVYGNDGTTGMDVTGAKPLFNKPIVVISLGNGSALVGTYPSLGVSKGYKLNLQDNSDTVWPGGALGGIVVGDAMYGPSPNSDYTIWKYPLDGSPGAYFAGTAHAGSQPNPTDGTLTSATFDNMLGFSTDGTNLYFADGVGGTETLVRMIDMKAGMVVTLAGTLGTTDIVDDVGQKAHFVYINAGACDGPNLYFSDNLNSTNGTVIRKVEIATRRVTTLAGDPMEAGAIDATGTAARFALISGLATDGKALYAMDAGSGPWVGSNAAGDLNGPTVREIELPSGRVTTMAGTRGQWTFRPGVGVAAAFNHPFTIAFDKFTHSLLFADYPEDVIVRIK